MKRTVAWSLAALLLAGCADTGKEVKPAGGKSPTADADVAGQETADLSTAVASDPATTAHASVDAEKLLASALETAKADNKRVLVHLGAPW